MEAQVKTFMTGSPIAIEAGESALERAASGKLGVCEHCGGRIPSARRRALPGTTQCIRCAKKSEASG